MRLAPAAAAALLIVPLLAATAAPPTEAAGEPSGGATISLRHCVVEYDQSAQMGPAVRGLVQDCLVKRGDRVKAGQVLCRLFDQDVRAENEMNEAQARNDLGLRLSEIRYAQAQNRLKRSQRLYEQRLLSTEEYEADRLDTEQAKVSVEEAKLNLRMAQLRHKQSLAQARSRELISPFDGVVVDILKYPGESVTESDVVVKLVNVDRLRVTGYLNVADLLRVRVGQPVRVGVDVAGEDLPIERESFAGRVDFLDSQIDPLTRTCKVVAEVDNRDGILRSGFEARMEILPARPGARGAAASAPARRPAPAS